MRNSNISSLSEPELQARILDLEARANDDYTTFEEREPEAIDCLPPLPPFPLWIFTEEDRQDLLNLSDALQAPIEYCAHARLGALALATSPKYKLQIDESYITGLNGSYVVGAESGDGKTPIFKASTKCFHDYSRALASRINEKNVQLAREQEAAEAAVKAARAKDGKEKVQEEELARLVAEHAAIMERKPQKIPQLLVSDCTPEKMASIAADQGGNIGSADAEGTVIALTMRYSKNGTANADFINKGMDGDPFIANRANPEVPPINISDPCVSLLVGVQPHLLREWARRPDLLETGTLPRCQIVMADSKVGNRQFTTLRNMNFQRAYDKRMIDILDREVEEKVVLLLSHEAEEKYRHLRNVIHEPKLRADGELGHIRSWGNKICGFTARVAGNLHVAQEVTAGRMFPEKRLVSGETMDKAIAVYEFWCGAALRTFAYCGITKSHGNSERLTRLLEHIKQLVAKGEALNTFAEQKLWQRVKQKTGHYSKIKALQDDLASLVKKGWLNPIAGSKPSEYKIHPSLLNSTPNTPSAPQSPATIESCSGVTHTPRPPLAPLREPHDEQALSDAIEGVF